MVLRGHISSDPGNAVSLNAEQWASILVLADKYDMTPLRNTAIQKLKTTHPRLGPAKQVAIARKHHCDELVNEPFQILVARKEVLSREEIAQLPLEDLHRLIVAREAWQREKAVATAGQCGSCTRAMPLSVGYCLGCQRCNSCVAYIRKR